MLNAQQLQCLAQIRTLVDDIIAADTPEEPVGPPVYNAPPGMSFAEVLSTAPVGAIIELGTNQYTLANFNLDRDDVYLRGGIFRPSGENVNDLLLVRGDNVTFDGANIAGDGTTKRGIAVYGRNLTILNSEIRNIRRSGQESQALAIWDSPGPLTVRDTVLEASTQSFLAGGSAPSVPNTIPTGLTFERVTFTRPLEWRGLAYAFKTIFELKCARTVRVIDCVLENMWAAGQTGIAITLHPSQYGNSPETVVEDVEFNGCTIRNCGGGVSMLGFSQHQNEVGRETLRGNNYRFIGNTWDISRILYGGQGALMTIGWEPENVVWEGNVATADGDAFQRITDLRPIRGFRFTSNTVTPAGTYGTYAPSGNYRGTGWTTLFPEGEMGGNTFTAAHATFRANFPTNTYLP